MEENIIDLGDFEGAGSANTGTTIGGSIAPIGIGNSAGGAIEDGEILDPNKVQVTIGDQKAPIIMLFGAKTSGKTMTLIRLANYLNKNGYSLIVDPTFRPGEKYRNICKEFNASINIPYAHNGTSATDFLLVKVVKHGRTICQFLEAPGEHYFDLENIGATSFPPYLSKVTGMPNRKIWIFIAESNWEKEADVKTAYVNRITNCKNMLMTPTDRTIILNNKIDQKPHLIYGQGKVHIKEAMQEVNNEYPNIFKAFKNDGLFSKYWREYNCKYVPFTTGNYAPTIDGKLAYTPGPDVWPAQFWATILKCINS